MIVVTTPYLTGYRVTESKGMVFGLVVRSRGLGGNLMASIRSLGGGEIHEYTSLLEDTRRQALDRLVQNATMTGANAVLSMRFDSSEIASSMSEIVAYGTAVIVVPDAGAPTADASDRMGVTISRGLVMGCGLLTAVGGLLLIVAGPGYVLLRADHARDRGRPDGGRPGRAAALPVRRLRAPGEPAGAGRRGADRPADGAALPADRRAVRRPDDLARHARVAGSGHRRAAVPGRGVSARG